MFWYTWTMKKILILIISTSVLVGLSIAVMQKENPDTIAVTTGDQAVALVKGSYPEYNDYPSDNLPPKRVEVAVVPDGWRVGMYVEGSGVRGILRANCFLVTRAGTVKETGLFQGEGPAKDINLVTCTPKDNF